MTAVLRVARETAMLDTVYVPLVPPAMVDLQLHPIDALMRIAYLN